MSVESKELRHAAGTLVHEARALMKKAETEKREMSREELDQFNRLHDEADLKVANAEALEREERSAGQPEPPRVIPDAGGEGGRESRRSDPTATEEYRSAFQEFLRCGLDGMGVEQRAVLQVDSDKHGGFVAASRRLVDGIIGKVADRVALMRYATVKTCNYGETLGKVGLEDDISDWSFESEVQETPDDDSISLNLRELKPRKMRNKLVKVSDDMIGPSSSIDVEDLVTGRAAARYGVAGERSGMLGDGADKPLGLFVASKDGIGTARDCSTSMGATAITAEGLIEAQQKLHPMFRNQARWFFHTDAITKLRQLKVQADGQFIWQPGLQAGVPSLILGKPYEESDYVPNTFTANKYVGMYGDFSYYWFVIATSMRVQRLTELYSAQNVVGLLFKGAAMDGMPIWDQAFVRLQLASG